MKTISRLGALVAASALAASGVALVASPAHAAPLDPRPVDIGATWLTGQLTNGIFGGTCSFDCGTTIDAGFALDAVGGHTAEVTAIADALGPKITAGYAIADEFDYPEDAPPVFKQEGRYSGALAKSIVFAQTAGVANLTTWTGGTDLVAELEARVGTTGSALGRIGDDSFYGDYANNIGQSYAVAALHEAGSPKAADALTYLLTQQCDAGYFRLFPAPVGGPDQTCQSSAGTDASYPDPDTTATAVRMLLPQVETSAKAARAIGKAEAWLLAQQRKDGSFVGGKTTAVPNANSTGQIGWTLGLLGDTGAARDAALWLRSHQADEVAGCPNALSTQTGAIGYDDKAVATGLKAGITASSADQWRRATSQALPALQSVPAANPAGALVASAPGSYVRAGSTLEVGVNGATRGSKVCVTGLGAPARGVSDGTSVAHVRVTVPAGTARRTFTVTDRDGNTGQGSFEALGAKVLGVKASAKKVRRDKSVTVTVSGLAPHELVSLRYKGRTVAAGSATATGTFTRKVKVGHSLGKRSISAAGEFSDIRKGSTTVKVVKKKK